MRGLRESAGLVGFTPLERSLAGRLLRCQPARHENYAAAVQRLHQRPWIATSVICTDTFVPDDAVLIVDGL